ncbi:hypothetical protein KI387_028995, partial [Taxus chinensis]
APYYSELAEKLIGEIKDVFDAMAAAETVSPSAENISERLGVDLHFQKEITQSLDYVYRYWHELHTDLNMTALGLRILRLPRYDVSSVNLVRCVRWWTEFDLSKLAFARHPHVEYHFVSGVICVEPKYYAFRKSFEKFSILGTILHDIYDIYGTIDELKLFTTAIKRWDPSRADFLEYMKIAYISFYKAINESSQDAEKTQG